MGYDQCDQIGEFKNSQIFPKVPPKVAKAFFRFKVILSKYHLKVSNYLGFFCKKICLKVLLKIAQSGHTDYDPIRLRNND